MIYFDNAATTLQKPQAVGDALHRAVDTLGNAARSFHAPAMAAARTVQQARGAVASLVGAATPSHIAFTSGATESLNLAIDSLIGPGDAVITTALEHNAVLRPLYRIGADLSYIPCDGEGNLVLSDLGAHLQPHTRAVVCTHGNNLLGNVTDIQPLATFCKANGLLLILDCAQTLGSVPVFANMADVLCFTDHKALYGPQGTGGIIAEGPLPYRPVKTGGTGYDSFAPLQPLQMPDVFEAGTFNAHGLAGLHAGLLFVAQTGVEVIHTHEMALTAHFLEGIAAIPGLRVYGPPASRRSLPIAALNLDGFSSEDVAMLLWDRWAIATRPGAHCAPLIHKFFGTQQQGMVRFSFGYFNTHKEVDTAIAALKAIAEGNL